MSLSRFEALLAREADLRQKIAAAYAAEAAGTVHCAECVGVINFEADLAYVLDDLGGF